MLTELALISKFSDNCDVQSKVLDLAEFQPGSFFQPGLNVLVTACFGHGEPTDNAKVCSCVFWRSLTTDC